MKRITLIFLLVFTAVLLSSCKVKSPTPTPGPVGLQVPTSSQPQPAIARWEYTYVIAQCQADMGTQDLVCFLPKTNDNTMLSSILSSKAIEGWELAGVANTGNGDGAAQTFIFKRQQ
jgi:hypothetical protein